MSLTLTRFVGAYAVGGYVYEILDADAEATTGIGAALGATSGVGVAAAAAATTGAAYDATVQIVAAVLANAETATGTGEAFEAASEFPVSGVLGAVLTGTFTVSGVAATPTNATTATGTGAAHSAAPLVGAGALTAEAVGTAISATGTAYDPLIVSVVPSTLNVEVFLGVIVEANAETATATATAEDAVADLRDPYVVPVVPGTLTVEVAPAVILANAPTVPVTPGTVTLVHAEASLTYRYICPTFISRPRLARAHANQRLLEPWTKLEVGISVIKENGTWVLVKGPATNARIAAAEKYLGGGREHEVDWYTKRELEAAGVGGDFTAL
jgi:hypothetical protein